MSLKRLNTFCFIVNLQVAMFLALCLMTLPIGAEQKNVNPGINEYYNDAEFQHRASVIERPGREVYDKCHAIVSSLALITGIYNRHRSWYRVLNPPVCNAGRYTSGKAYSVDISENFIENIVLTARIC